MVYPYSQETPGGGMPFSSETGETQLRENPSDPHFDRAQTHYLDARITRNGDLAWYSLATTFLGRPGSPRTGIIIPHTGVWGKIPETKIGQNPKHCAECRFIGCRFINPPRRLRIISGLVIQRRSSTSSWSPAPGLQCHLCV